MSKRLQVLLPEEQYEELRRIAAVEGVTVAAWVRQVLADACCRKPYSRVEAKLSVVREAVEYGFPTADVDQMNREILASYDLPPVHEGVPPADGLPEDGSREDRRLADGPLADGPLDDGLRSAGPGA